MTYLIIETERIKKKNSKDSKEARSKQKNIQINRNNYTRKYKC